VLGSDGLETAGTLPPGTWEVVAVVLPTQSDNYTAVVPTLADSSTLGTNWSVHLVTTHTTTPAVWFASEPDSGYSVDNIAPGVPLNFAVVGISGQGDVDLSWDESGANDFQYFNLYRDESPGFTPSEANRIAQLIETSYLDPQALQQAAPLYYKVAAVDHAGNEGAASEVTTGIVAVDERKLPNKFALYSVSPNPIGKSGIIRFDLPKPVAVELKLYDARGRLVRTAHGGDVLPAGSHQWTWDGRDEAGRRVSAGVYFYRMIAGSFRATERAVVMD